MGSTSEHESADSNQQRLGRGNDRGADVRYSLPVGAGRVCAAPLDVSRRYFGYGALIFVLFQLLSLWAIWALRDQPDTEPELLAAAT